VNILFISNRGGLPFERDLIPALADRRHTVTFFDAGCFDLSRQPRLRWGGNGQIVRVELLNTPNVPLTSGDPETQTEHPLVEQLTAQVLDRVQPDLVSIGELSGHTLSVLELLQAQKVPTVVTVHNYWPLCPQLNLLDASGQRCDDFESGARCCRCRWLPRPDARFWLDLIKTALRETPLFAPVRRGRQILRQILAPNHTEQPGPPGWGPAVYSAAAFARRRQRAITALNQVQEIHALSTRSAALLAGHGLSPEKIKVIPFLLSHFDHLAPKTRVPSFPLTFGYRGNLSYAKGIHVLIQAFAQLDQKRARLVIYGSGEPDYLLPLRRLAQGLNIDFKGAYVSRDLIRINHQIDVGVVPSVWEETFCLSGLEFLYSGVPLIASRLGGMVDYVEEGVNGFLVAPGDAEDLAQVMLRFLDDPALVTQLSSNCRPRYSMDQVTETLEGLYRKVI
jgi:glycosyltransferase involved in cell wall biosynthesis